MNFIAAVAYHFWLALPAAFTQPVDFLLAEPCRAFSPPLQRFLQRGRGTRLVRWRGVANLSLEITARNEHALSALESEGANTKLLLSM